MTKIKKWVELLGIEVLVKLIKLIKLKKLNKNKYIIINKTRIKKAKIARIEIAEIVKTI